MMRVEEICQKLELLLTRSEGSEEKLERCADAMEHIFGVRRDEVAIFMLDPEENAFSFAWPPELRKAGTIPAGAENSLVAITAKERRGSINNSFATTPHLFVFESLGEEKTEPIQKIMSVPMLRGEELRGVIQVSRKGAYGDAALRPFTEPELNALEEIAKVVACHI